MNDETRTHYRKAFNSPYLSSADIVDPVTVTIQCVTLEVDRTKKTKDLFNTAHFAEREIRQGEALKPMILNATNSKLLAELTGSKWIDDWQGVPIEVYVDGHVRFGKETVEGLRLRKPVAGAGELESWRGTALEGYTALQARYKDDPPSGAFWKQHAHSLKLAAQKVDNPQ